MPKRIKLSYILVAVVSMIIVAAISVFLFSNHSSNSYDTYQQEQEESTSADTQPNSSASNKTQEPSVVQTKTETPKTDKPVLKGLGVEFAPLDGSSSAGDFLFSNSVIFRDQNINSEKVLLDFGVREHSLNNPNENIEYWYFLKPNTKIRSIIAGKVRLAYIEHTKDWSVNVKIGSGWTVSFEHLKNLNVKDGDIVSVGDVLGEAVAWSANSNVGFTELAVWRGGASGIYKYCPFDFLDESLKPDYKQKIERLASDWEQFIGKDVYKQDIWVSPGCVKHEIKEA